ncbi:hypothetical protein A0256_10570 [Mucilaginibacter sp. PAMC 26640]|nr:hypothetical protein A0256_10570 [Mucilaginibacter sp. PAMC 26640]
MAMLKKLLTVLAKRIMFAYEQSKLDILLKNPMVSIKPGLRIEEYFTVNLPHNNYNISFGENVHFKKYCHLLVFENGKLAIGANVFFNNYCSVNCLDSITIGADTLFGEGVKIYDHNHRFAYHNQTLVVEKAGFTTAPVVIGANCWIGSNVTILKGVTIGDNTIIGANNLIYKSVPPNTIVKARADHFLENPQD